MGTKRANNPEREKPWASQLIDSNRELRRRLEALLAECEDYLLWEPRKRGHAAVHNRFSLLVRDTRAWADRETAQ